MNSREKILKEIAQNKPAVVAMPSLAFENPAGDHVQKYLEVLHSIGGKGQVVQTTDEVLRYLQQKLQEGVEVVNGIQMLPPYNGGEYAHKEAAELEGVHTAFLEGGIAVAENSAIWLTEKNMVNRALPFICQELVLLIREEAIVTTMHEAYKNISVAADGYGVFIAGPSKTADIEQSLVIGAHGPLSLEVFVLASPES